MKKEKLIIIFLLLLVQAVCSAPPSNYWRTDIKILGIEIMLPKNVYVMSNGSFLGDGWIEGNLHQTPGRSFLAPSKLIFLSGNYSLNMTNSGGNPQALRLTCESPPNESVIYAQALNGSLTIENTNYFFYINSSILKNISCQRLRADVLQKIDYPSEAFLPYVFENPKNATNYYGAAWHYAVVRNKDNDAVAFLRQKTGQYVYGRAGHYYVDWFYVVSNGSLYREFRFRICPVILVLNGKILFPEYSYFPNADPNVNFIPAFFDKTYSFSYVVNNSVSYLYDADTRAIYMLPSITCADYTSGYRDVPIIEPLLYEYAEGFQPIATPQTYYISVCGKDGVNFRYNYSTYTSTSFVKKAVFQNNSERVENATGYSFAGFEALSNLKNLTITGNDKLLCVYSANSSGIFLSAPDSLKEASSNILIQIFGILGFALGLTLSFYNPFSLFLSAVINDIYQFLHYQAMVFLMAGVGVLNVLFLTAGKRSLKHMGFYTAGFFAVLASYLTVNAVEFAPAQAKYTELSQSFNSLAEALASGNIATIFFGSLSLFLTAIQFIISLPITAFSLILSPLESIDATLYTAAVSVSAMFTLGLAVYFALLIYIAWNRLFIDL